MKTVAPLRAMTVPPTATAERGEKLLALKVAAAVAEIRAAREAAPPPAAGGAGEGLFARAWRWLLE
jgi:hypothetical protein